MTMDNLPRRDITREEARRRTDEFKVHTEAWLEELVSLHDDQVWWALGYSDWTEYCAAEFGSIRLPRGAGRTGAIVTLRQATLSIRDIASALGLGRGTVERELNAADSDSLPDTIVGADGKEHPASKSEPEMPVAVDDSEAGVPNGTAAPETEAPTVAETPVPEPVSDLSEPKPLRPIDELLAELVSTVAELQRHCKAMTFPFPGERPAWDTRLGKELDPRQVRHHPFTDGAHKIVSDISERLHEDEGVARDLSDAEDLRAIWPTMTPTQKRHYVREMEEDEDHDEYKMLWKLRYDKQTRHELRAEVDARVDGRDYTGYGGRDFDLERLQKLDERAKAEGWDDES